MAKEPTLTRIFNTLLKKWKNEFKNKVKGYITKNLTNILRFFFDHHTISHSSKIFYVGPDENVSRIAGA